MKTHRKGRCRQCPIDLQDVYSSTCTCWTKTSHSLPNYIQQRQWMIHLLKDYTKDRLEWQIIFKGFFNQKSKKVYTIKIAPTKTLLFTGIIASDLLTCSLQVQTWPKWWCSPTWDSELPGRKAAGFLMILASITSTCICYWFKNMQMVFRV